MFIKDNYVVKKRNILNEIRANSMSLQELRFFSIYLSKINPNDTNTRIVRFNLDNFKRIMDLGRINIEHLKNTTNSLLCKVVNVPNERGGYHGFNLFKECRVDIDNENNWYVEITAHDKALPLMFEFKEKYFTYKLWNALRLKSSNQLRMYEILKQYEKIGRRVISIDELKELLGIKKEEYPYYKNFRVYVLEACKIALEKYTDIKYTYEPIGKKGKGGKIINLEFIIEKNHTHIDHLTLENFMDLDEENEIKEECDIKNSDINQFLMEACNNEFTSAEIQVLYNIMMEIFPYAKIQNDLFCYDYLKRKYDELKWRSETSQINKRFNYIKSLIEIDKKQIL